MSTEIVSGKFLASDAAVNIECGFVPDYVRLISALGGTEIGYEWWKVLYDYAAAATGMYGFVTDAAAPAHIATENGGIVPYNISIDTVFLPATDGNGYVKSPAVIDWLTTVTPVARVANGVLGTCIRPTVHNGMVYECTISGGVMGTEPTSWPLTPGATVSDTNNTYVARVERVVRKGCKGFTVGVDISTNGEYWVFKAEKHDRYNYMGDADIENPVFFADHHHI